MKYEFAAIEDIKFKILDTESWLKKTFQLKEICDLEDSCQSKFWSSKYLEPFSSVRLWKSREIEWFVYIFILQQNILTNFTFPIWNISELKTFSVRIQFTRSSMQNVPKSVKGCVTLNGSFRFVLINFDKMKNCLEFTILTIFLIFLCNLISNRFAMSSATKLFFETTKLDFETLKIVAKLQNQQVNFKEFFNFLS